MKILSKKRKKISKVGVRGAAVFIGDEIKELKWKKGQEVHVISYSKAGKKGILIEKH